MYSLRRKEKIKNLAQEAANNRINWIKKNYYFHHEDMKYLSFLIPEGSHILDLGCGTGDLLASLKPSKGVGIDFSSNMIKIAKENHPHLEFHVADIEDDAVLGSLIQTFDYIILSDTIGSLNDCQKTLSLLHKVCNRDTRIIISYYSYLWEPVLKLAEFIGLKMTQVEQNYLTTDDIINCMNLSDIDLVAREWRQLIPISMGGIGSIINKYIATLPLLRRLCLRNYVIGRSLVHADLDGSSCSIIVPCKNEKGNIENVVKRIPEICDNIEIIFVVGNSSDGTIDEIKRVIPIYADRNIKFLEQNGVGKADATFTGFDHAKNEVLIILDADLTVPPEQLNKFWEAIKGGKGEFINGSRLVYPMEDQAMRYLNVIANYFFSIVFSWLLNQRYTDTLCGTKALRKIDYLKIKSRIHDFSDKDPFGDFYLIFGSTTCNLKMIEVPIMYSARQYGETQIHRFRHGWQLMKLAVYGYTKLKAF